MMQSKSNDVPQITIEAVSDPVEVARHCAQDERHARNLQWLESHWSELGDSRGRFVAVADQQAFIGETAAAAWEWARREHPDDDGAVVMFVPAERAWRIYATRR